MFEIVIQLPGKPETIGRLERGVYRIGSSPAAHIQIDRPEVSARHALLTINPDSVSIQDAGSSNGTYLNDQRVSADATSVPNDAVIAIGEARLQIRDRSRTKAGGVGSPTASAETRPSNRSALLPLSGIRFEYRKVVQQVKREIHGELLTRLNLKNLTVSDANAEEVRAQARQTIHDILDERRSQLPSGVDIAVLEEELIDEAVALGPLEKLLRDSEITEIMVNGAANVYIEKAGTLYRTDLMFADDQQVLKTIERIVAPIGRRIDESQPLVDARLADGSRVNAIIPPLAIDGPSLTIRKFSETPMTIDDLVGFGALTRDYEAFLRAAVHIRKNILISGGTGSGKTTLLNVVSDFIPEGERIVTIEDAAELRLSQAHIVRLEARPPNIEGKGQISIRDLVRNALRMRPDRIVVGECRGGEALDMLQAMNTGHDGSLSTIHANDARDGLTRLETLVLMAGFDLPLRAIREQIASAISLVVHVSRLSDGSRKVMKIVEVTGMEGDIITTQDLFSFRIEGTDEHGRVHGQHVACGMVPTFAQEIARAGLPVDFGIFNESST